MIPYFQGGYGEAKRYLAGSEEKKIFICPLCGRLKDKKCLFTLFIGSKQFPVRSAQMGLVILKNLFLVF